MNDEEWLATRRGITCLAGVVVEPSPLFRAGVVVEPTHVLAAVRLGVPVIAVVGWPTGRHHSVVKATEARLAQEQGAAEVWLAVDAQAALADVIAVRQGVDVAFGAICPTAELAALLHGVVDHVVVDAAVAGELAPGMRNVTVCGVGPDIEDAVAQLEGGAQRVFSIG